LANQYGSDKGTKHLNRHGYTRIYSELLQELRMEPLRLLEIGLLHPSDPRWLNGRKKVVPSLMMWSDYLPSAHIIGFDIADFSAVSMPRVSIYRGDASSRRDLQAMIDASGGQFDIVIDDASHASHHQQIALGALFKHVAPGGMYVIEDLQWQPPEHEPASAPKTRDVLQHLNIQRIARSPYLTDAEARYLESNVERIAFFDSLSPEGGSLNNADALAIIFKGGKSLDNRTLWPA
jgi:hypothetical protein